MALFLESGGRSGAELADDAPFNPAQAREGEDGLSAEQRELLAEVERLRQQRFEAAKDKMSDEPTPIDTNTATFTSMVLNATQAPGRGSATQAAGFLRAVLSEDQEDTSSGLDASTMRMEEFTLAKEQRIRQMGAEILTVDPTYRAVDPQDGPQGASGMGTGEIVSTSRTTAAAAQMLGLGAEPVASNTVLGPEQLGLLVPEDGTRIKKQQPPPLPQQQQLQSAVGSASQVQVDGQPGVAEGEEYKPKVSTWGVFPRPRDISKEYGGGRDLKPGQEIETREQKAAREAAYRQALNAYRSTVGLEVDEEAEQQSEQLYEEGMALFGKANLQGAYNKFQRVLDLVPIKSKYGGMAGLQAAIILDSTGNSEEAQKLYKQLRGHAVANVARKANQMLFGFKAAKFLKADQISYAARKGDFDKYFRPLADRNKIYVQSEEERLEDERKAQVASLIALAIILAPVALVAGLAIK